MSFRIQKRLIATFIVLILSLPLLAVQPDEVLDDPELEERARAISAQLRCVVCQGESIDASDAQVARTMRIVIRERLEEGLSDQEIYNYMRARYGDFVLLKPRFDGAGALIWLVGPLLFLFGGAFAFAFIRKSGREDHWDDD